MNSEQIKYMVDRFLGWRLPDSFSPDAGISFKKTFNEHTAYPGKHEPVGTNLFDATQAEAMVRYLVKDLPVPSPSPEARGEWPTSQHALGAFIGHVAGLNAYLCELEQGRVPLADECRNYITLGQNMIHRAAPLTGPSPPAVVGKPTKEALCKIIWDHVYRFANDSQMRSDVSAAVDALLAAPIWPTAETPTTVDATTREALANCIVGLCFGTLKRPHAIGDDDALRIVDRMAMSFPALITGKKG